MEYVRTLDDLMLQINGTKSNEAVMKIFNILYPYDKPLPTGRGDEASAGAFFDDGLVPDLKDCHPDKLRENMEKNLKDTEHDVLKNNAVDDLQSLLDIKNELMTCRSALDFKDVSIEEKDRKIEMLEAQLAGMKIGSQGGLGDKESEELIQLNTLLQQ